MIAGTNGAGCGYPGAPAHSSVRFTGTDVDDVVDEEDALLKDTTFPEGTVATYSCERGFELLGPARRQCQADGTWAPEGVPFCGKHATLQQESHVTLGNDLARAYFSFSNRRDCGLGQLLNSRYHYTYVTNLEITKISIGAKCYWASNRKQIRSKEVTSYLQLTTTILFWKTAHPRSLVIRFKNSIGYSALSLEKIEHRIGYCNTVTLKTSGGEGGKVDLECRLRRNGSSRARNPSAS